MKCFDEKSIFHQNTSIEGKRKGSARKMNQPKHRAISCLSSPLSSASNFRTSLSPSRESERYLLVARKSLIGPKRLNQLWQSQSWGGNQLFWILVLHFTSLSAVNSDFMQGAKHSRDLVEKLSAYMMWRCQERSTALRKWGKSTLVVPKPRLLAFWRSSENVLRQTRTCISVLVGVCMFNFVKLVFSQKASSNVNW